MSLNFTDLIGLAMLLLQLTSWLSLREGVAALRAEFREFKAATRRELDRLARQVS